MSAAPNVLLAIVDACGDLFCVTFADNTERHVSQFREHAEWWKRYARSHAGQKAMQARGRSPAWPVRVVVEPYADGEIPPSLR